MCGECGLVCVLHARGPCGTTVLLYRESLGSVSVSPTFTTG